MAGRSRAAALAAALSLVSASAAYAQGSSRYPDPAGYCNPASVHLDTRDTGRDAPPIVLPKGFTRRTLESGGYRTQLIEGGPRRSSEAIVLMHGNPGSSLDWLGVLRAAPRGARVVAFDLLGFGAADKPWDFSYTLESTQPLFTLLLRKLGIKRVHLVGHDIGGVVGVEWMSLHPRFLASAVFLNSGVLIGYEDHDYARIWKQPVQGELFMASTTRPLFHNGIQSREPKPLPREFIDRNYDYFDRPTRCAILKAYRSVPDVSAVAERQAARLRQHNRPALVIWGAKDSFIDRDVALRQRDAFPRAQIHFFEDAGHWPFVTEEQRTVALMRPFLARQLRLASAQRRKAPRKRPPRNAPARRGNERR